MPPNSTLATSCEKLTHWKRLWCWEGLGAGGKGDDRGWDGWMASPTRWMWVWVNSGSWWWTGRPGVLQFKGSQRVGHHWVTELNWTELKPRVGKMGRQGGVSFDGYRWFFFFFWVIQHFLQLIVVIVAQFCKYTKNYWILCFKCVILWYMN